MARYNTVTPAATTSANATYNSPTQGLLTTLTGTAPYTVTLANPELYVGVSQTFFNTTGGTVTIATATGTIKGPGFTTGASQVIPNGATYMLTSDGTDYVITNNEGGPQAVTTLIASGTITANGTLNATSTATLSGATVSFTGASVVTSASQTLSGTYDVINKNYLESKYGQIWAVRSTGFTATAGGRYFIDTSSVALTATLPASPAIGDTVEFIDLAGTFAARNLTVGNNGNRIMRVVDTMTVSTNGAAFGLVWSGNTAYGWLIASGI
jgi:hypothetical protein